MTVEKINKDDLINISVDPTANVLKHVEGAVKRLDDLQVSENRRINEVLILNVKRLDDLRASESRRIDEEADMMAEFSEKLRDAEAKRIDAIRAVDVNAVAVASERASAQATVLANQVTQSADALRNLVANTATTMATQQDTASKQFNDRLAQLEKAQYESKGKSGVEDPMMAKLFTKMDNLIESGASHLGVGQGMKNLWGYAIGGIGLIALLLNAFGVI